MHSRFHQVWYEDMKRVRIITLALLACSTVAAGQISAASRQNPDMKNATIYVYKRPAGAELKLWLFSPSNLKPADARPAILLFSGGGWKEQNPAKLSPQARHFANMGLVAMVAEYRVLNTHGTTPYQAVADGKSAVRWVREHAHQLHISPDKLIVGGASAGGHIALATALVEGLNDPADNQLISARPDALVLFNPVPNTAPSLTALLTDRQHKAVRLLGPRAHEISPIHLLSSNLPPTIIFHGESDTLVPFSESVEFCRKANQLANRCELVGFKGVGHGFFHRGREDGKLFRETLSRTDQFLMNLGYLP